MFKTYADLARSAPADHPGQPVHSEPGFDVWQDKAAKFFVVQADGTRRDFPSLDAACKSARELIKDSVAKAVEDLDMSHQAVAGHLRT